MASVYRRTQDGDTWHFCENCSHWPTEDYLEQRQAPRTGGYATNAKLSGVKETPVARTSANVETPNCGDRLPDVAVENIENVIGEVLITKDKLPKCVKRGSVDRTITSCSFITCHPWVARGHKLCRRNPQGMDGP
jgi:hypothetical protein